MTYNTLGIIPAAGKAERFGGIIKECLPIGDHITLLTRICVQLRDHCNRVVLVTSPEKIATHARDLRDEVIYMIQEYDMDIMGALIEGMRVPAKRYIMAMPDTYIPGIEDPGGDFAMGMFWTVTPERFGVLSNNKIVNKEPGIPREAWGVLIWSDEVRKYWMENGVTDYTTAINMAIEQFGYNTFDLDYYYDMATFEDYKTLVKERLA